MIVQVCENIKMCQRYDHNNSLSKFSISIEDRVIMEGFL